MSAVFWLAGQILHPQAIVLAYFAPLPIAFAGLAAGASAAWVAVVAAAVGATALNGPVAALSLGLAFGAPVAFLVSQSLLTRQGADGAVEWYPLGWLAAWLAGLAVLLYVLVAGFAFLRHPEGLNGFLAEGLSVALPQMMQGQALDPAVIAQLAGIAPAIVVISWMMVVALTAAAAQALAVRFGRAQRPTPRMATLVLPRGAAIVFGVAVLASLLGGELGRLGLVAAAAMATAYGLQGLGVIHAWAGRFGSRGGMLAAVYVLIGLFAPAAALVVVGVLDHWFRFRGEGGGNGRNKEV